MPPSSWRGEFEKERIERGERLCEELYCHQLRAASIRGALSQDWEAAEHDIFLVLLDRLEQRITDIQQELNYGPDWATNGHGEDYDE